MAITLTDGVSPVTLPDDIFWEDEFSWSAVQQNVQPTLSGAICVEVGTLQAGREITLKSGSNFAWISRATLDQLNAWKAIAGKVLTLTIRGVARNVIFRHHQGDPLNAEMVLYHSSPAAGDYYTVGIKLMEV